MQRFWPISAFAFGRFLRKKPDESAVPQDPVLSRPRLHPDFSLRASGTTYIERSQEAVRVTTRIDNSSSSVVGIAGVRGAGKSSLAKRVLDTCDQKGYFTLLIPSPTGYEPREFLIAIFQRIAEHCIDRTGTLIKGEENLNALGLGKAGELRRRYLAIALSSFILMLLGAAYSGYYYGSYLDRAVKERIAERTQRLNDELAGVNSEITALQSKRSLTNPKPAAQGKDTDARGTDSDESRDASRYQELLRRQEDIQFRLNDYSGRGPENDFLRPEAWYESAPWYDFVLILGSIICTISLILIIFILRQRSRYLLFRRNSKLIGLYYLCQDFLEFIKYQTTLGTGKELGLTYSLFSGKLTSTNNCQTGLFPYLD